MKNSRFRSLEFSNRLHCCEGDIVLRVRSVRVQKGSKVIELVQMTQQDIEQQLLDEHIALSVLILGHPEGNELHHESQSRDFLVGGNPAVH